MVAEKKVKSSKKSNKTLKNSKHIFGKVFANWCGACKALKPEWLTMVDKLNGISKTEEELQKQMELDEPKKSILINKDGIVLEIIQIPDTDYDSYKNERSELKNLEANGYPTIFRKMNNSPIEYYNGSREPDAMIQWAMGRPAVIAGAKSSRPAVIAGGSKKYKKSYNKTHKNQRKHKKSCNACNSGFSQTISKFWGWK